jgi:hypothetical protein
LTNETVTGDAVGVDADARLLVSVPGEFQLRAIAAGDVTHVRPISR